MGRAIFEFVMLGKPGKGGSQSWLGTLKPKKPARPWLIITTHRLEGELKEREVILWQGSAKVSVPTEASSAIQAPAASPATAILWSTRA